ncbi:hypothetical protein TNCV_1341081 [Trichonephila clavipes]|uniref:Uncharacterized protein n=1 Tax=Trichonephila clavipes TaxID=2585209 RepID=A0A8X6RWD0_TRICX|nr:hypothetical protein TNCV_1341081 [Trichonephila clavipes]
MLYKSSFALQKALIGIGDRPVSIVPHRSLNSSRGVTSEAEILDGFSDQGVDQIYTTHTISNSLSTSAAFSSTNKTLASSNISMFTPLPAETCPAVETETSISNTIPSTSQTAKQTSKSRKKRRPKRSITSKIDIQLTPHKPKKSTPLQDTSGPGHAYIRC